MIHIAAPGQFGSVISELEPSHATAVNTDQVRVRRYDAVRPDVLSHLALGNGYSSYDPIKFQYTDNEYLNLLITTGVLGMMGLLAIFLVLLTVSHPLARAPDTYRSNPALALHAMVVMVMVCSALFDSISFGHVSYMLFMISGMLVAMQKPSVRALQASRAALARAGTALPSGEPARARVRCLRAERDGRTRTGTGSCPSSHCVLAVGNRRITIGQTLARYRRQPRLETACQRAQFRSGPASDPRARTEARPSMADEAIFDARVRLHLL